MTNPLFLSWLWLVSLFNTGQYVVQPSRCLDSERSTAVCNYSGWVTPGYASKETWRRDEETPLIFYGRATYYHPGLMESTALLRGFDPDYLDEFDCLVSGFFINDVGRTAWMLHEGNEYRCLVVDNARARDIYKAVMINREAVEVSWEFAESRLGIDVSANGNGVPVVAMAYQAEKPTVQEWQQAVRLDEYLWSVWEGQHYAEPIGWVKIDSDQRATYRIIGYPEWLPIPGSGRQTEISQVRLGGAAP